VTQEAFKPGTLVTVKYAGGFVELYSSLGVDGILRFQNHAERTFYNGEVAVVVASSLTGSPNVRAKAYIMCPSGIGWVYSDALEKVQ